VTQAPTAPGGVTGLVVRRGFALDPDALVVDGAASRPITVTAATTRLRSRT
jgi:hypothetical protein